MSFARKRDAQRSVEVIEPYGPRPVSALGTWRCGDWRIKKYTIAYRREAARQELIEAAEAAAVRILPTPAVTPARYGVGFLGVHDGCGGNFVFVDWGNRRTSSTITSFFSTAADPGSLRPPTPADPIACVWDLGVVAHEREVWVRHVLAADVPDLDAYLEDQLDGEI